MGENRRVLRRWFREIGLLSRSGRLVFVETRDSFGIISEDEGVLEEGLSVCRWGCFGAFAGGSRGKFAWDFETVFK